MTAVPWYRCGTYLAMSEILTPEAQALLDQKIGAPAEFAAVRTTEQEFLDLAFSGDPAEPAEVLDSWPLTAAELEDTFAEPTPVDAHSVARLRYSHHEAARLFALGARDHQVAEALGYSTQTVYLLRRSPAFTQLVLFYSKNRNASVFDVGKKLDVVLGDTLSVLHERVLAGQAKTQELVNLTLGIASRRGFPETLRTHQSNLNITLSAEEVEAIKQGARAARAAQCLEQAPSQGMESRLESQSQSQITTDQPTLPGLEPATSGGRERS